MIATLVLAAAIGSCPKPVSHKHHKPAVMQCTCIDEPPRTIWLTPPEPDIEPIPLSIYPYYISLASTDVLDTYLTATDTVGYIGAIGGYAPSRMAHIITATYGPQVRPLPTPEIDASSFAAFGTMLACALAVLRAGRRV